MTPFLAVFTVALAGAAIFFAAGWVARMLRTSLALVPATVAGPSPADAELDLERRKRESAEAELRQTRSSLTEAERRWKDAQAQGTQMQGLRAVLAERDAQLHRIRNPHAARLSATVRA